MHPLGALATGAVAGGLFVAAFQLCHNRLRIDDVLGVWPLHGLCGMWGGIACGIFGTTALGGMGGISLGAQIAGTLIGAGYAFVAGLVVYGVIKMAIGLRLDDQDEFEGSDLALHRISSTPEIDVARH
jgi:Amt family ammonium transporter